jgi:hypothetical protein
MSKDQSHFFTTVWHTQHHKLSVITAHQTCSQKHVRYKLTCPCTTSATTSLLLDVELTSLSQKSGFVTTSSVSTAASTASNGNSINNDFLLLARLQGIPIYAPPSLWPSRTGARVSTKTQIAADRKSKRELKQKAAEEKKHVAATCKVEREP